MGLWYSPNYPLFSHITYGYNAISHYDIALPIQKCESVNASRSGPLASTLACWHGAHMFKHHPRGNFKNKTWTLGTHQSKTVTRKCSGKKWQLEWYWWSHQVSIDSLKNVGLAPYFKYASRCGKGPLTCCSKRCQMCWEHSHFLIKISSIVLIPSAVASTHPWSHFSCHFNISVLIPDIKNCFNSFSNRLVFL